MKTFLRLILIVFLWLNVCGCATIHTLNLSYDPGTVVPASLDKVKVAVLPFEDASRNGLENTHWVGEATLYGLQLHSQQSISYGVTRAVKSEMAAYGYQLSPDEIYSLKINRKDLKTLLKRIPHLHVGFLVGGTINHFFIQQLGRLIADIEIEAYLIRLPQGEVIWTKKIGHRDVRLPYPPDELSAQSQVILNNLLDKTLKDLFRNSDFRVQTLTDKKN